MIWIWHPNIRSLARTLLQQGSNSTAVSVAVAAGSGNPGTDTGFGSRGPDARSGTPEADTGPGFAAARSDTVSHGDAGDETSGTDPGSGAADLGCTSREDAGGWSIGDQTQAGDDAVAQPPNVLFFRDIRHSQNE